MTPLRRAALDAQESHAKHASKFGSSGIHRVAEDKIVHWEKENSLSDLANNGKPLPRDFHQDAARALHLGDDHLHAKLLADNGLLPESVLQRQELDARWAALAKEIQRANEDGSPMEAFRERIEELDGRATALNEAILSDTLRFKAKTSPVRHSRRFLFEERVKEAIDERF